MEFNMADKKINKDNILSRAQLYSQSSASRLASNAINGMAQLVDKFQSKTFTPYNKNKNALIDRIQKFVREDTSNSFTAPMFDENVLNSLNNTQLKAIADMVSKVDALSKRASALFADTNESKYLAGQSAELAGLYKQAIDEMSPYFEGVNLVQMFGADGIQDTMQQIDSTRPSKSDIELVEAFKLTGVELRLNSNNKWVIEDNQNGQQDNLFSFSKDEVRKLVEGYLNASDEQRNGRVITPDGLFKVYRERAVQKIENMNLNSTEKNLLTTKLEQTYGDMLKQGTREFVDLTDQNAIIKNAQKVAFAELSSSLMGNGITDGIPTFSEDLTRRMENNELFNAGSENIKLFTRLQARATSARDYIADNTGSSTLAEQLAKYDRQIDILKNKEQGLLMGTPDPEALQEIINQQQLLEMAKENFQANVEFMKNYVTMQMNGSKNKEDLLTHLQSSVDHYWVKSNGGDFTMVDRHHGEGATIGNSEDRATAYKALEEIIKSRILAKSKANTNSSAMAEDIVEEIKDYPDILNYVMNEANAEVDAHFVKDMDSMARLKFAEVLFAKGAPLDQAFEAFKQENQGATINDFINVNYPDIDSEDFLLCDRQSLVAGYEKALFDRGETPALSEKSSQHINTTYSNYNQNLVLLDRAVSSFTPEELKNFSDPTYPDAAKQALVNQKLKEARAKGPINAVPGNKEFDTAMARHNNNVLGKLLSKDLDTIGEAEQENGGVPAISNALKKYVESLSEDQKQKDEDLTKQGEKKSEKKPHIEQYKELRPASADQVKFEKAMKGYSTKELKKRFIKELLKSMKLNTFVNMDAYYARKNQGKNGMQMDSEQPSPNDVLNKLQKMQEASKALEEKSDAQQQEQEQQASEKPIQEQQGQPQEKQIAKPQIKQKEYDASVFLPGLCLIEKAMTDIKAQDPMSEKLGNLNNLRSVFQCLSTIDNMGNEFTNQLPDGTDFRSACRNIAFDICKGELKDKGAVKNRLTEALAKYSIQSSPFVQQLEQGFENLTPELMNYLFEFSSDSKLTTSSDGKTINTITLGTKLPKGLDKCTTDQARREYIKSYMEKNLINYKEGSQMFDMLVNDLYKDGSESGFDRISPDMEFSI